MQEEQEPQISTTVEAIIEPHPNNTTMEVDIDISPTFGDLVGEIIEKITLNGDKSPKEPEPEVVDLVVNGDKSPEIQEIEVISNDDKSSEAEPDEIEILDD